ncbi:MAG: curli-like amyloid fiber formation chaperone CsgH [Pseudomonadota bacterium]
MGKTAHCVIGLAGAFAAISASAADGLGETKMESTQALKLEKEALSGAVEIRVLGHSSNAVDVSYTLSVTGNSTTRHAGKTRLSPGVEATLSRVKISTDGDWCAVLEVEEQGRSYTLTKGMCPAS